MLNLRRQLKRQYIKLLRKLSTHDTLYWVIKHDWHMVRYMLKKYYWRKPVVHRWWRAKFKIKNFRQLRKHPHNKWFYHLPTFTGSGLAEYEEYIWCSCWGCGCCIRKIGLCTLYRLGSEYDEEYFQKDSKQDPLVIFYNVDGVEYALEFHHDNPPYGLLEGGDYIDLECFMRLNECPDEDMLDRGEMLHKNFRRTYATTPPSGGSSNTV